MANEQLANFGNRITESTEIVMSCVRNRDLKNASSNLKEIKSDAAMMIRKLKLHVEQLESVVKLNMSKEREIKEKQYQAEREQELLQKQSNEIIYKIKKYRKAMDSARKSLQQSECLYNSAETERRERGEKVQELRDNFFVPFYGLYLLMREVIEQNARKEEEARTEAARHRENCKSLKRKIASYENQLRITSNKLDDNEKIIKALSYQWNELHIQTGDLRNTIADLKRIIFVRKEQSSIAAEGQKNIDNLDKKLLKAMSYTEKQQEKFCSSKATKHSIELLTKTWNSMFTTEYTSFHSLALAVGTSK